MDIKAFFHDARVSQHEIERLEARAEKYRSMATKIGGMSESTIRSTDNRSRIESAILDLVDLADTLANAAETYARIHRHAEKIIKAIPQDRYREVLTKRYIMDMPWSDIITSMGYKDSKSVFRCHGWALMEAQKKLDEMPFEV